METFALFQPENFRIFLWVMAATAVVVFIALNFVEAGYGAAYTRKWGPTINNRLGWVLMEAPVFIVMCVLWLCSSRRFEAAPLVMFCIFQIHYFQRSFIFPLLIRTKGKMPLSVMLMGITFNTLNALMQGGWIFYVSAPDRYPASWLGTVPFLFGTMIFFLGMYVNIHSDNIIRSLRRPGDTRHYLPVGGMFHFVTSANYLGELMEWVGFAILTWSWAGAVFALWTFANLAPRARKINERYQREFGPLSQKSIIPLIY